MKYKCPRAPIITAISQGTTFQGFLTLHAYLPFQLTTYTYENERTLASALALALAVGLGFYLFLNNYKIT